jgi:hypothetical protein
MVIVWKLIERDNYNKNSNCNKKIKWWPKLKEKFDMKIQIAIKKIEIEIEIEIKIKILKIN